MLSLIFYILSCIDFLEILYILDNLNVDGDGRVRELSCRHFFFCSKLKIGINYFPENAKKSAYTGSNICTLCNCLVNHIKFEALAV